MVCPNCGNKEEFRVDAQLDYVATYLKFHDDDTVILDASFPDDITTMCPTCAVCGEELPQTYTVHQAAPDVMCPSCKHYIDADVTQECPFKKDYPSCFKWDKPDAELELEV